MSEPTGKKLREYVERISENESKLIGYQFKCPGCKSRHCLPVRQYRDGGNPQWTFNNDFDRPTFNPSVLTSYTWGEEKRKFVCHIFVREGMIEYLSDCTHELAGQTVPMPDWDGMTEGDPSELFEDKA